MEDVKKNFYELCIDCLYYGYFWGFIKKQYKDTFIATLGENEAKKIYDRALKKMED